MFACDLQPATRAFIFLGEQQPMRASHAHAIASPPASVLALAAAWHGATAASALQRVRTRVSCPAMTSFCARVDAVRIACLFHRLRGPCQACRRDAHDVGGPSGVYLRSPPTTTATPTIPALWTSLLPGSFSHPPQARPAPSPSQLPSYLPAVDKKTIVQATRLSHRK